MKFQYVIKVNGLPMCTAPTKQSALAKVTQNFHDVPNVIVERDGVIVWKGGN